MKRRLWLIPLAAVAGFLLLCGFRGGFGGRHPWRVTRMVNAHVDDALDDLKANEAQRKQVHTLVDGLVKDGEALRTGHDEARQEALTQWKQPNPDSIKLHGLVDSRMDSFRGFAHRVVDAGIQLHGILTPEQRVQVSERIESHHR